MIMKRHISYAVGASLGMAVLWGGCNKQAVERPENDRYPVQFSCAAPSETTTTTKVTGEYFDAGEVIGMFAYPSTLVGQQMFGTGEDIRKNVPYVAQGGSSRGQLMIQTGQTPIYFPSDETKKLSFKGYYPYSSEMTADGVLTLNLSDQSAGQKGAILYSNNNAAGVLRTADFVELKFRYVMAQVVINFSMSSGEVAGISAVSIEGVGVRTACDFYVSDGSVKTGTFVTGTRGRVEMKPGVATTQATVVPGAIPVTDLVITVVTPLHTYVAKPKDLPTGYLAGNQYIYNVTLKGGGEAEIVGDETTILPWEAGNDVTNQTPIIGEQEN